MVLYKRNMFAETIAYELQKQVGVEKAFSIRSIEHLYNNRVKVEYVLLEEIGRDEEATLHTERLYISPNIIISEYKERCKFLEEKIENLKNENIKLEEENDRLWTDLRREINPYSERGEYDPSYDDLPPYDGPILEGTV